MKHLRYTPPWKLSRWGWGCGCTPRRACDEFHNKTWYITLPFGAWVLWPNIEFDQVEGEEHVYAHGPEGYEGIYVPSCELCIEFKQWVEEERWK